MHCRTPVTLTAGDVEGLGAAGQPLLGTNAFRAKGCDQCLGGYDGRTGIFELMVVTPPMRESIRSGASQDELARQASESGMLSLIEDGVRKVQAGDTTVDELHQAIGHL